MMRTDELEYLPDGYIHDCKFKLDIDNRCFIKPDDPTHVISFDHMVYRDTHYEMDFDLYTLKPYDHSHPFKEDVVRARIKQLVEMAPYEMAQKYNVPLSELQYRTDFDLAVNVELYERRKAGERPELRILDRLYKVDMDMREFVREDNILCWRDFPYPGIHGGRTGYIDVYRHRPVDINHNNLTELPQGVVQIEIPMTQVLDPYWMACNFHPDKIKTYLMNNPIIKDLEAKVTPLEETHLKKLLLEKEEENKRYQREMEARAQKRKTRQGRGMR